MTVSSSSVILGENAIVGVNVNEVEVFNGSEESLGVLIKLPGTSFLLRKVSYHIKITCYDFERIVKRVKEIGDVLENFDTVYHLVWGMNISYQNALVGTYDYQYHCYGMMSFQRGYEVEVGVFPKGHYASCHTCSIVGQGAVWLEVRVEKDGGWVSRIKFSFLN